MNLKLSTEIKIIELLTGLEIDVVVHRVEVGMSRK